MDNSDIKLLSRKLILSVLLFVLATLFLAKSLVTVEVWKYITMAIVASYIAGKALDKSVAASFGGSLRSRLIALFSREFIFALVAILSSSAFLWYGKITCDVWFEISVAIGVAYNILNPIAKITK